MVPYHKWPVSRKITDAVNFLLNKIAGCLLLTYPDMDTLHLIAFMYKNFAYYVYVLPVLYFGLVNTFTSAP